MFLRYTGFMAETSRHIDGIANPKDHFAKIKDTNPKQLRQTHFDEHDNPMVGGPTVDFKRARLTHYEYATPPAAPAYSTESESDGDY